MFDLRAPSSTDVSVLLLNQPIHLPDDDLSSKSGLTGSNLGPFISPLWTADLCTSELADDDDTLRFGSDALRDEDFITEEENVEDGALAGVATVTGFGGTGRGKSTDSLFRERLRYSSNDT